MPLQSFFFFPSPFSFFVFGPTFTSTMDFLTFPLTTFPAGIWTHLSTRRLDYLLGTISKDHGGVGIRISVSARSPCISNIWTAVKTALISPFFPLFQSFCYWQPFDDVYFVTYYIDLLSCFMYIQTYIQLNM